LFLDEGGNLDFSSHGTKHFILTSVTKERSIRIYQPLTEFKYDLIEFGINLEYFHASEDNKKVRDRVFQIIHSHLKNFRIDSMIVDKQTAKSFSRQSLRFYSRMLGELIRHILWDFDLSKFAEVIIITDQIPLTHRRQVVEKSIKQVLKEILPPNISYRIFHHESKSNLDLQVADYCSWAVFRKWERNDLHYFRMIQSAIKSESKAKLEERG
jgi:hypothetical protein